MAHCLLDDRSSFTSAVAHSCALESFCFFWEWWWADKCSSLLGVIVVHHHIMICFCHLREGQKQTCKLCRVGEKTWGRCVGGGAVEEEMVISLLVIVTPLGTRLWYHAIWVASPVKAKKFSVLAVCDAQSSKASMCLQTVHRKEAAVKQHLFCAFSSSHS